MLKYFHFGNKRSKRSEEVKGQEKRNGRKVTAFSKVPELRNSMEAK